jgi:hypothetical protein
VNLRPEPGETLGVGANLVGDVLALHQNRNLLTGQWALLIEYHDVSVFSDISDGFH